MNSMFCREMREFPVKIGIPHIPTLSGAPAKYLHNPCKFQAFLGPETQETLKGPEFSQIMGFHALFGGIT